MSSIPFRPVARIERIAVEELDGELLIYDLDTHKAHCLNGEAAAVWDLCDGSRSVADLSEAVAPDLPPDVAEQVVHHALSELAKRKLLVEPLPEADPGVSRREVLRKLAVAGAVGLAIPVVKSIVAPTAAQAATCLPYGAACTSSAQCCSGVCAGGFCAPVARPAGATSAGGDPAEGAEPLGLPPGVMAVDPAQCASGRIDSSGNCM